MDWSGAPLVDTINPDLRGLVPDLSNATKKVKGKRRPDAKVVNLERIMGYTDDADGDDVEDDDDEDEEDDDKDGVLERDSIKRMAAKMEARAAKELAERQT